jgi:hypothetical protein
MCDSNTLVAQAGLCVGLLTSRHPLKLRLAMGQYIQEHPGILELLTKGESTEAFMNVCIREIKASQRKHADMVYVTADYDGYYGASDHAQGTMCISSLEKERRQARYSIRQQGAHGDDSGGWELFRSSTEDNYYIVEGNKEESFEFETGAVIWEDYREGEEE